jgi:alpha-tubulin suppressor-like RCC1 family protein
MQKTCHRDRYGEFHIRHSKKGVSVLRRALCVVSTALVLGGLGVSGSAAAATEPGGVSAWGSGGYGELGDGSTAERLLAAPVPGLTDVVAIDSGRGHVLALRSDGTVVTWGSNGFGQLGDGTRTNRSTPAPVAGVTDVVAVAAGSDHSLAVRADGTVLAWGWNGAGELGDGSSVTVQTLPVRVQGLTNATSVSANNRHSLAVTANGTVMAWGSNNGGQLGSKDTTEVRRVPGPVAGLTDVTAVAAGSEYSMALHRDGTVSAWGRNKDGQLGDGTNTTRPDPRPVDGLTTVVDIAAGSNHGLAVLADGTARAWGFNRYGQLGDGTTTNQNRPVTVRGLSSVTDINGSLNHSIAATTQGFALAWGLNHHGQLGNGTFVNSSTPTLVVGLSGVQAVSAGSALSAFSVALTTA